MDDATIQNLEIRYKKALEDNLYEEAGGIEQQIHNLRKMETLKLKLAAAKKIWILERRTF